MAILTGNGNDLQKDLRSSVEALSDIYSTLNECSEGVDLPPPIAVDTIINKSRAPALSSMQDGLSSWTPQGFEHVTQGGFSTWDLSP